MAPMRTGCPTHHSQTAESFRYGCRVYTPSRYESRSENSRTNRRCRPASAPLFHLNHYVLARRQGSTFGNKMKRVARVMGLTIGLFTVYLLLYFALMVHRTSYDSSGEPKFGSASRFASNVRLPWNITIYGRSEHWTNYIFLPLDRLFRRTPTEDWATQDAEQDIAPND